jgi:hypothetical protein
MRRSVIPYSVYSLPTTKVNNIDLTSATTHLRIPWFLIIKTSDISLQMVVWSTTAANAGRMNASISTLWCKHRSRRRIMFQSLDWSPGRYLGRMSHGPEQTAYSCNSLRFMLLEQILALQLLNSTGVASISFGITKSPKKYIHRNR